MAVFDINNFRRYPRITWSYPLLAIREMTIHHITFAGCRRFTKKVVA